MSKRSWPRAIRCSSDTREDGRLEAREILRLDLTATVVSQWKAESASTKELMIAFHRALRGGDEPAHALRAAQLALMRKPGYEHPFYWAPFIVVEAAR